MTMLPKTPPPYPDAVPLPMPPNPYLPQTREGLHTGGLWLYKNEVYKPTQFPDRRSPEFTIGTFEAEALTELAGLPMFPKNWRTVSANGITWIVRPLSLIYQRPPTLDGKRDFSKLYYDDMDADTVIQVENAMRIANASGWEIGDFITVGLDPDGNHFIVDLSTAIKRQNGTCNDWHFVAKFLELAGAHWLLSLRKNALNIMRQRLMEFDFNWHYVYASFNRPISPLWAHIPEPVLYIDTAMADWSNAIPHTWVLTTEPLPDDVLYAYELKFGWQRYSTAVAEKLATTLPEISK